ncbi:MAG: fumarylacetoacetate hydrolase family protein [Acidobacteria bacterium]|nr:fumarylacetoacetate hydrolase family protein [Acidobacteriota bacterium]
MKLVTFRRKSHDEYRIGKLTSSGEVADLTDLAGSELTPGRILELLDNERPLIDAARGADGERIFVRDEVDILAPVPRPGKLICIGLNYRDHAAESNMAIPESPVIFSKFSNCVIGAGSPIVIPPGSTQVDYEAELAFVIGRHGRNVPRERALEYVLGYTNLNDVSSRDFQFADGQWQRGKSCETFAPMGEYILTTDEVPDPQDLSIKLILNGEIMQDSNTCQMIFGVAELVEFLSRYITLEPGDVVATGTPPGVGFARKPPVFMKDGDTVEVEIAGLGRLSNPVRSADV